MISNNLDSIQLDKFPVIIFGSGPAGISTTLELEKKNINSIIIEAEMKIIAKYLKIFIKEKLLEPDHAFIRKQIKTIWRTSGHGKHLQTT